MLFVALVNVLAIPTSSKKTLQSGGSLILSINGPCVANRETNCFCSSNFAVEDCDNSATPPTGVHGNNEDCDMEWTETVELTSPFFDTESCCDAVTVDHHCSNIARDTTRYVGSGDGITGAKGCNMHWRSDGSVLKPGFKVCGISLWANPGGKPPQGGSFPGGTVPPDHQACPCGTNPTGAHPGGSDAAGDNCFTNPVWPCPRLTNTSSSSSSSSNKLKVSKASWADDVHAILARNNAKTSPACCVCIGGWMEGYDPEGDGSTETELGVMTRPECIEAAKAAGGNAASIDDTATDTVTGTCYSETNAHFSAAGWVADSTRQACLFGA